MQIVYTTAAAICLFGAVLTLLRLIGKKSRVREEAMVPDKEMRPSQD
jgi:hypothetical protein